MNKANLFFDPEGSNTGELFEQGYRLLAPLINFLRNAGRSQMMPMALMGDLSIEQTGQFLTIS